MTAKQTVAQPVRHEGAPVKGSRFIVDIAPAASEDEARAVVAAAGVEFPDASHHCSAWRLQTPPIERANDDGEPGGSAGRPILAQLAGRDLVDTAAVVTRYFGGTKLGVGGLVRAYGGAVGEALDTIELVRWLEMTEIEFAHEYALTDSIDRAINDLEGVTLSRDFASLVRQKVKLPLTAVADFETALADLSHGTISLERERHTQ